MNGYENDRMLADHDEACEDLRALVEAENQRMWEDEQYAHYAALDEDAYREWLVDNDLPDTPDNRSGYEDYLCDAEEARSGA